MAKRKRKRKKHRNTPRMVRYRLVGGPFHGRFVELDADAREAIMVTASDGWASHYVQRPDNNAELIFTRTEHISEWHIPDNQWAKTSSPRDEF